MKILDLSKEQPAISSISEVSPQHHPRLRASVIILLVSIVIFVIGAFVWVVILKKTPNTILNPLANDSVTSTDNSNKIQNPITGELSEEFQASTWKDLRPLGVMVNNYVDARPQSGLIYADVVYEIVAEGGITRFLAFYLSNTPEKIGPVRSTREYYLVLVKELGDAMLMHIGWSPQALEAIETWPVRSLGRGGGSFWRDQARIDSGVAIEHTAYVNGIDLRAVGDSLGWQGKRDIQSYKFKDVENVDKTQQCLIGECTSISIDFWYAGDYSAIWKYNRDTNTYLRSAGYDAENLDSESNPIPHLDQETNKQIEVKNLVVQFVPEVAIEGDDKNRLTYELVGTGSGLVFIDGKAVEITWRKDERATRTLFYDTNGNEVEFNRGKFWVSIVPDRNVSQVVYTSQ